MPVSRTRVAAGTRVATIGRRPRARLSARVRRRRAAALAIAVIGLTSGALIVFSDMLDKAIEEVTLPLRHEDIIRQQAERRDLDPGLIAAVIYAESRFHDQTSHAGARGLMQITPHTADAIEKLSGGTTFTTDDLADPDINIRYGTFYLRYLLDHYQGNEVAALAAYNAGETNVNAWGGADLDRDGIRFHETRGYVDEVLDKRDAYRHNYSKELGLGS